MEKIIFLNQKMYFNTLKEIEQFQDETKEIKNKFIIFPSNLYIENFIKKGYTVGSQNISSEDIGPHTGEISAQSLNDIGCQYTIIGHSEIRQKYKEENTLIQSKINKATQNNLKVILCIGETLEEKKKGKTLEIIKQEIENLKLNENVMISYEPIWSIGTNKIPTNKEIEEIIHYIQSIQNVKVLYGGSVNEQNIHQLNKIQNISGFLLGGCNKKINCLKKIIEVVSN